MAYNFPNRVCWFYRNIYKLVDDPSSDPIISWNKSNNGFVIWNIEELLRRNMFLRFTCEKFSEFHSELKTYGFIRIKKGAGEIEYGNEDFVRGQPERLLKMKLKNIDKKRAKFMKFRAKEAAKQAADSLQNLQI